MTEKSFARVVGRSLLDRRALTTGVGLAASLPWLAILRYFVISYQQGCFIGAATEGLLFFCLEVFFGALALGAGCCLMIDRKESEARIIVPVLAAFCSVAASIAAAGIEPGGEVLAVSIASALSGCGTGALLCLWLKLLAELSDRQIAACVILASLVGSLACLAACVFSQLVTAFAGALGSALSALLVVRCRRSIPTRESGGPDKGAAVPSPLFRSQLVQVRLRISGAAASLGFAYAAMTFIFASVEGQGAANPDTGLMLLVGVATVLALLLAGWLRNRELDFHYSFRLCCVLLIASFFPLSGDTELSIQFAFACDTLSFVVTASLALMLAASVERVLNRLGSSGSLLGVIGTGVGAMVGLAFAFFVARRSPLGEEMVYFTGLLSVIGSFLATNVLLSKEHLTALERVAAGRYPRQLDTAERLLVQLKEDDGLAGACKLIVQEKCLTEREAEVLAILARGHSLARVQEDLFISEGTAVTHRRHIYRKLDVHSKQELIDFVDGYSKRATAI